ncbi:hypothetical protein SAY86_029038 [Trapa natans]|uniref:Myosin motor domain-containing protein n=1 Tax=Trapa natans TaxID=22666 RepID=A0AAN7RBB8_TRANT|nr:hypothetical protein SAY86_029038 [Trapa natans]
MARSSLEEMLYSLRCQDEAKKSKDLPPALPTRPTAKARLPTLRQWSLPFHFKAEDDNDNNPVNTNNQLHFTLSDVNPKMDGSKRKEKYFGSSRSSFGSKKMKKHLDMESPYSIDVQETKARIQGFAYTAETGHDSDLTSRTREPEWEDNIGYFIKKKLSIWCRLVDGQWGLGTILSTSGEQACVLLSSGTSINVPVGELLPANPDILEGVEDLIQLSYLNEPSVLHCLQYRYSRDMIYSKAGPVLVAINPFKDTQIYGRDVITSYRNRTASSPHVYTIADTAYNEMMRDDVNQSIIISGESGAGKTETAKIAMQYLAALGGSSTVGIKHEILQTSCILEAFGNSKTTRNDNSSRFSRVVQLATGERSFHVFYQLCAGAPSPLQERLNLKLAHEYNYLNQSGCLTIDGVDDAKRFDRLLDALDIVRIPTEDQEEVFAVLAAILWLGNVTFKVTDSENHVDVIADEAITTAARLMGCTTNDLVLALSTWKIVGGTDSISKKLTLQQATDTRDALAKFLYARLFDWLVEQINKSLEMGKQCTGKSINILDIYGFESFQKNRFEQFCINYANERLQQHFNRHLFKLELEDYEADGIDWTRIDFEDNEDCLDLIEKKLFGILSLLDEESNFPKATDLTFANKLKQHLNANACFRGERDGAFSLCHYAGEVLYDTSGFLEKNRDPVLPDLIQFLSSTGCKLPRLFASRIPCQSPKAGSSLNRMGSIDSHKQSVGAKFKSQLFKLMHQLETTKPHFIRCIKPNSKQLPGLYEEDLVLQQLRCCGVIEVVRISRSGYPTRMPHQEFAERYGFLLMGDLVSKDPLSISVAVLQQFNIHPEMYQVGFTKLYLRTGQIATLEDKRKQLLQSIVSVQKYFRGHRAYLHFHEIRNGAAALQSFVRGEIAQREFLAVKGRDQFPAPTISPEVLEKKIIYIQSVIRKYLARKQLEYLIKNTEFASQTEESKDNSSKKASRLKDTANEQVQVIPTKLDELQKQVLKAELTLDQKKEENAALRGQLREYETKWSDYEARMKSMEETWKMQMASLEMSLAAARKNVITEDHNAAPPRRVGTSISSGDYDYENVTPMGSQAPVGTGSIHIESSAAIHDIRSNQDAKTNGNLSAVTDLIQEFELKKQTFEEDARSLGQEPSELSAQNFSPDAELRKLKARFEMWKKDYKVRLRKTKAKLHKLRHREASKCRKWWGKIR